MTIVYYAKTIFSFLCRVGFTVTSIEEECHVSRFELFTSDKSIKNIKLYERLGYVRFKEKAVTEGYTFFYLEKYKGANHISSPAESYHRHSPHNTPSERLWAAMYEADVMLTDPNLKTYATVEELNAIIDYMATIDKNEKPQDNEEKK